ncbi:hypothetical protein PAXRUDRAFT_161381 [Paxillus rubicundulus Ve08.2h10]|uniref:Uncharacterized protein n=1 Tax=Paxillus rubicundulus Ve08.2h10 TaxID=930991 RepID=A0A0D0D6W6_9AGAM|nr:hypothetical protein PAXRUDRAFT_161381 [Paxillus rubicundulus Ve08.2h10]
MVVHCVCAVVPINNHLIACISMGNGQISNDLKEAALHMLNQGYDTHEVVNITHISKSTL